MPDREVPIVGTGKHQELSVWRNTRERDAFTRFGRIEYTLGSTETLIFYMKRNPVQVVTDTIERSFLSIALLRQ